MRYPSLKFTPSLRMPRFNIYSAIFIWIILFISPPGLASTLTPFDARYDVYRNDSKVGLADFSLKHENGIWRWDMQTKVTGFYRFLTKKRPFTITQMQEVDGVQRLIIEQTGDYPEQPAKYTTWFDHSTNTLYSLKDDQVNTLQFPDKLYNYHSIHLAYPAMQNQELLEMTVNFYRKGKISTSTLTLERQVKSEASEQLIDRMTQRFGDSNKLMVYDYQRDSVAPIRIEQIRPGKDKTLMKRLP